MAAEILPAIAGDQNVVADLPVEQMREHRVLSDAQRLRKVVGHVLVDPQRGYILVAKDDGRLIGVAYAATILSVEHGGYVAWLEELYVSPSYRGKGVGTALLEAVMAQARQLGLSVIDLEVDVEHRRAESLYRRFGFHSLPRSRWAVALPTRNQ
jgi:GNAT superfamily N-acetyltransferase